jgi:hypothetical protein
MKLKVEKEGARCVLGTALGACLIFLLLPLSVRATLANAAQDSQGAITADEKRAISAFEERVKEYVKLREQSKAKLPKLSKDSTPEQIQAHKDAFEVALRAARAGAKPGDLFTAGIAVYIRRTLREEFKGKDRQELRKTILQAETQGVPLRVNYTYPESKELTEMPPTLLLKLPQLPKEMKYRFVGQHMLLVDRESGLIIDYMLDALP